VTTDKINYEEASTHLNFVIETIQAQSMFKYITLTPNEFYSILLYKDMYNFGGIKESVPDLVSAKWDIAHHLPEAVQNKFRM